MHPAPLADYACFDDVQMAPSLCDRALLQTSSIMLTAKLLYINERLKNIFDVAKTVPSDTDKKEYERQVAYLMVIPTYP